MTNVAEHLAWWVLLVVSGCLIGLLVMTALAWPAVIADRVWPRRVGRHRAGWQLMDGGLR